MAKVTSQEIKVEATITVTLNEIEMRAFDALTGYGFEPFVKVFKKQLGESYLRGNEKGLESLWALRGQIATQLKRLDEVRRDIREAAEKKLRVRLIECNA